MILRDYRVAIYSGFRILTRSQTLSVLSLMSSVPVKRWPATSMATVVPDATTSSPTLTLAWTLSVSAAVLLRRNLFIYGFGGLVAPFVGIKIIDVIIHAIGLA